MVRSILLSILLSIALAYPNHMNEKDIIKYINSKNIIDAHIALCNYDESLCKISSTLLRDFVKDYNRIYLSIVKVESGNFKYRKGLYYKFDYGLPQVNTKVWTPKILRKFGFKINNPKQLIYDDKLALDVGYVILWHNIVYGYIHGKRYRTILEYASHYHTPTTFNKHYYRKVRKVFYKIRR